MDSTSVNLLHRMCDPREEHAWHQFVDLYAPLIMYWGRQQGVAESDLADLVQDILMTLVEKIGDYDVELPGRFRGWLRTITLHRAVDFHRRRKHQSLLDKSSQLLEISEPGEQEIWHETAYRSRLVGRALDLLRPGFSPTTWRAGYAQLVQGQPARQVAQREGISVNAVYIAKSRLLEALRREVEGLLD